jgi:opacity protein-like surface antigen
MLESDPVQTDVGHQISPPPAAGPSPYMLGPVLKCSAGVGPAQTVVEDGVTYVFYIQTVCTRQTTIEQGFAPTGIRISFLPGHRLQPTLSSNAGYMFSTKPVPTATAGSFNYTFDFGAGIEYYLSTSRSVRLEYQVQHFSNKETSDQNPGVDSGFVKLTYAFGR